MPLMNATGYRMGFLLFLVANSIFTFEEFVITISFLRLRYSQVACARTSGMGRDYCIHLLRDACGIRPRMLLNADGNSTNTVI